MILQNECRINDFFMNLLGWNKIKISSKSFYNQFMNIVVVMMVGLTLICNYFYIKYITPFYCFLKICKKKKVYEFYLFFIILYLAGNQYRALA